MNNWIVNNYFIRKHNMTRHTAMWKKRYHLNLNHKQYQTLKMVFNDCWHSHMETMYTMYNWTFLLKQILYIWIGIHKWNIALLEYQREVLSCYCNIIFSDYIEWVIPKLFIFNFLFKLFNFFYLLSPLAYCIEML